MGSQKMREHSSFHHHRLYLPTGVLRSQKLASHPKKDQPANPNNKKQYVSFLQGDTQQWGGAGDEEVPGGQGGGRQLGLPQAEDRRHLPGAQEERACSQLG